MIISITKIKIFSSHFPEKIPGKFLKGIVGAS